MERLYSGEDIKDEGNTERCLNSTLHSCTHSISLAECETNISSNNRIKTLQNAVHSLCTEQKLKEKWGQMDTS